MTRDFIGYGGDPPHAGWPGEARIAVNFVINFEEGSELSYPAGDGVSESMLTEMVGSSGDHKSLDNWSRELVIRRERFVRWSTRTEVTAALSLPPGKLGRSASLIGFGILFLAGGWYLEKVRRKLVARTRPATSGGAA